MSVHIILAHTAFKLTAETYYVACLLVMHVSAMTHMMTDGIGNSLL